MQLELKFSSFCVCNDHTRKLLRVNGYNHSFTVFIWKTKGETASLYLR